MKNLLWLAFVCTSVLSFSQSNVIDLKDEKEFEQRIYQTKAISNIQIPKINGVIDDDIWDIVEWGENFTVHSPNNGDAPKRQTKFKILYDEQNVFIAFRCYHEDPDNIENRLARRDHFPGDWVELNIDSYFDKTTAFSFTISASGVKGDEFVTANGNNWDSNWNPIWYAKTNIDEEGWTAEMQIPLSQLRFGEKENHIWGMNITRRDFTADERSTWQWIPQNRSGWVSNFAEVHGISGIKPVKQLEIQPFVVSSLSTSEAEVGNPFEDGSKGSFNIGIDGKYGLTSDLTLDFTINPDFGQVEADPSRLTLDGFRIFFGERRPFFVENANLFKFQISNLIAGGSFGNDNLFYSRRIGARPSSSIDVPSNAYTDIPDFTSILASAKVSGKTKNGWSISMLESITAEEFATTDINGERDELVVEPFTNYFVAGLAKDFRDGATRIGGKLTGVHRKLNGTGLEDLYHKEAVTGGLELFHSWKGREWQIEATYIFSHVEGTVSKITETQESFEHYFQRPDADHLSIDENATNLKGNGGSFSIGNFGGKDNISFQTGVTWRSPGIDLNDIGFLNTADEINHVSWAQYRFPKPFSVFRSFNINVNHYQRWTTGGEYIYNAVNTNLHTSFKNSWGISAGGNYEFKDYSPKSLFGGPMLRRSPGFFGWFNMQSDQRKKVVFDLNFSGGKSTGVDSGAVSGKGGGLGVTAQPSDKLRISLNPSYNVSNRVIQNVDSHFFNGNTRYITGTVRQETFSMSMRLNYSFSPDLTIQYWGQPFISKGNYKDFKYITDPLATVYTDRFALYDTDQISYDSEELLYHIDDDRDGSVDYSFNNPDFNFLQFRSNLVLRWEYRPGSEFFLVWTQSTTNSGDPMNGIFPSLKSDLFGSTFNNIFLMKFTYRFINS